jgi:hypothetical protein
MNGYYPIPKSVLVLVFPGMPSLMEPDGRRVLALSDMIFAGSCTNESGWFGDVGG